MNKRGQSEVITTVLIILLVLAAVFIVYTAVRSMVTNTTNTASNQANCMGITFTVTAGTATNTVTVLREAGGSTDPVALKFVVGGQTATATPATSLSQLESATYTLTPASGVTFAGSKVEVAADGCNIAGSVNIPAAA